MNSLVLVVLIRLFVPLTIFIQPFWGGIFSMIADASDVMIFEKLGYCGIYNYYHIFDKAFDIYYLFIEFFVIFRWKNNLAKNIGVLLFVWRFIGFILYEITKIRSVFFFCPNIFEFYFLAIALILLINPEFKFTKKTLIIILFIVGVPNVIKEYYMHYLAIPTWDILRDKFFWRLY